MATVWLAEDEQLDRSVAVKFLSDTLASDPDYVARFAREARIAARVAHRNLVDIYDVDAEADRPYLVMEHVAGGTLDGLVARGDQPPAHELAHDLLSAVRAIHEAGIVHRDIKPENVLVGTDGRVRLTDFGIARGPDATKLTRTGEVIGTIRYLAPEIREGAAATAGSDLFALGVTLRESIGGAAPRELIALVTRLSEPDPRARFSSAAEALGALGRAGSAVTEVLAASVPEGRRHATPVRGDASGDAPVRPAAVVAERRFVHVSPARVAGGTVLAAGVVALALALGDSDTNGAPLIGPAAAKPLVRPGATPPQPRRDPPQARSDGVSVLELGGGRDR